MRKLIFGQRLDSLAEALVEELAEKAKGPLEQQVVLVPAGGMRGWLQEVFAKRGIVAGYRVSTAEELGAGSPLFAMASAVFSELRRGGEEELKQYIGEKEEKEIELAEHLAHLFQRYGEYAPQLFQQGDDWQRQLLRRVCERGNFRAPVQVLPKLEALRGPVYCFGIDFLPPCYWEFLCRAKELFVYLFSPCDCFWEDICSDWEKRRLLRSGKKRGVSEGELGELETYLQEAPKLLANWGKLGRETLEELGRFEFVDAQCKAALHLRETALEKTRQSLKEFQKPSKEGAWKGDASIRVLRTGSSRFLEVEMLCEEILALAGKGVQFSQMGVFAPNLNAYAPLIELLFSQREIPYRMLGVEIGAKNGFLQGLKRLLRVLGRGEGWEELFETSAFLKKRGWEDSEKIQEWLAVILGQGTGALLKGLMRLDPEQKLRIEMGDSELLEEFVEVFQTLSEKRVEGEKTLREWALFVKEIAEEFLVCEEEGLERSWKELKCAGAMLEEETFPLSWVERFFERPILTEVHPHHLHGVRVAPFAEGNLTVQRALFLLGMDEESFPRARAPSSLDLLKGCVPERADFDRYLFLRALFSAEEYLRISYGHLSKEEGKPIGPSVLVEELLECVDGCFAEPISPQLIHSFANRNERVAKRHSWNAVPSRELPEEERVVSLSELMQLARHPWKFYLRKNLGIWLEERGESLGLQKAILLREALTGPIELPKGRIEEAISLEVREKVEEWKRQIAPPLFSAVFLESCRKKRWIDEARVELPCLRISVKGKTRVRIVGEIQHVSQQALLFIGEDQLQGLLRVWPEWLCSAIGLGIPRVLCLKTGKIKEVEGAEEKLERYLEYFFAAEKALSPLLPQWGDALLRGGKKKSLPFRDPVVDWVTAHIDFPKEFEESWREFLQWTFEGIAHAPV